MNSETADAISTTDERIATQQMMPRRTAAGIKKSFKNNQRKGLDVPFFGEGHL